MTKINFSAFANEPREIDVTLDAAGSDAILDCGYIPPDERTKEQKKVTAAIFGEMPRFNIRGRFTAAERHYPLWKCAYDILNRHPYYIYQQTGSCVGAAAGQMIITAQSVDIKLKGLPNTLTTVFWPYHYGMGRMRSGLNGRGEGSFGSGQAKALIDDGTLEDDGAGTGLPDFKIESNWAELPSKVEMDWSNGKAIKQEWRDKGVRHRFKTAAPVKSADDATEALINGYPITVASMFGFSPMVPPVKGTPPVRLVESWNAEWSHQMSIHAYWDHPTLGEIYFWLNNWGPEAHGDTPGDEPVGGFYTTKKLLNEILKSRGCEAFAFSSYDGFPAQEINFSAF